MFKNQYGEIRSGWIVALSIVLMIVGSFVVSFPIDIVLSVTNVGEASALSEAGWLLYLSASLIGSILFCLLGFKLIYKRPLKQMGFHAEGWIPQLLIGGLIGIVLFGLATGLLLITGTARVENINFGSITSAVFWAGFVRFIFVGFSEEIACRGLMMTALKTTRNKVLIISIPSILFGLLHLLNDNITVFSIANIILVGILFSYLFIKTGRLWVPIGFHITWNFVQGFIWGIPVSGIEVPSASMMRTTFIGPDFLTGGAFGVEGGAACTLVLVLGLLVTHFFIKQNNNFWRIDSDLPLTRGENL